MLIAPADDHRAERARVLALLGGAGAAIEQHRHPLAGPQGEPLSTDVGRLGAPPGEAHTVVIVASGTHGVEGHSGSALQALLLEQGHLDGLAPGVAVVVVHAVNPYGMAWERRVDHDNVDVNRNFVDFAAELPTNPGYEDLREALNPTDDELDLDDDGWVADVLGYGQEQGMLEMFHAVSGGQYAHPEGVQFGGRAPTWSRTVLEDVWRRHAMGATAVVNLDVHTGLGPCGALTTFQTADEGEAAAQAAAAWFPTTFRSDRTREGDPVQLGVLGPGMDDVLADVPLVVPVVLEWGTRDETTVLAAMRADNWLHAHGDPRSPLGDRIRATVRDAFALDDEGWRGVVAELGVANVRAALDAAAGRPGG